MSSSEGDFQLGRISTRDDDAREYNLSVTARMLLIGRVRIEAICLRRELALAARLRDSAELHQLISEHLDWYQANPDFFSDAQFDERRRNGEIETLRHLGAPDWLIRARPTIQSMIGRVRRLFRIAWPPGSISGRDGKVFLRPGVEALRAPHRRDARRYAAALGPAQYRHGDARGLEVSPGGLLQNELVQRQIRDHLAQPAVLELKVLQAFTCSVFSPPNSWRHR